MIASSSRSTAAALACLGASLAWVQAAGAGPVVDDDPVWRLYGLGVSTPREMVTMLDSPDNPGLILISRLATLLLEGLAMPDTWDAPPAR